MKTKLLIIIVILVGGFVGLSLLHLSLYKTWGNNEHYYLPVNGMEVVCNVNLWQHPSNCHPINDKGEIVKWPENIGHLGKKCPGDSPIDLDPDLSPCYISDSKNTELDEIERQRKIDSMLNTGGAKYGDNSGNVEYWDRAKVGSLSGLDDQEKFELCVKEFMDSSIYPTSPAQEYLQQAKAQQFCS